MGIWNQLSDSRPDLSLLYRCFSLDHDEDVAAAAFERRYGCQPEWVFEERNNLWVGPIPALEEKHG